MYSLEQVFALQTFKNIKQLCWYGYKFGVQSGIINFCW